MPAYLASPQAGSLNNVSAPGVAATVVARTESSGAAELRQQHRQLRVIVLLARAVVLLAASSRAELLMQSLELRDKV